MYTYYFYLENKNASLSKGHLFNISDQAGYAEVQEGTFLRWIRKSFKYNLLLSVTIYGTENGLKGSVMRNC